MIEPRRHGRIVFVAPGRRPEAERARSRWVRALALGLGLLAATAAAFGFAALMVHFL